VRTSLIPRPFTRRRNRSPYTLVAIAEEVGRRGVVREGAHDLLGRPSGSGVLGHIEVDDAPAMVSEHDEDEEDAQASGGHGVLDGKPVGEARGADVGPDGLARFDRSGMIRLVARAPRGNHVLTLASSDPGLQVYVFTFGPYERTRT
jgi:hypothetical protein